MIEGTYYCHVENSVGKGDPCMIDLTESIMLYGLSEEVVVILIAVAGSVIILLLIILITACLYCREKTDDKGKGKYLCSPSNGLHGIIILLLLLCS